MPAKAMLTEAEIGSLKEQGLDWVLEHISEQDADIERLKHQNEWIIVENTQLKMLVSELEKWIYNHHYAGDSQAIELMERARKGCR